MTTQMSLSRSEKVKMIMMHTCMGPIRKSLSEYSIKYSSNLFWNCWLRLSLAGQPDDQTKLNDSLEIHDYCLNVCNIKSASFTVQVHWILLRFSIAPIISPASKLQRQCISIRPHICNQTQVFIIIFWGRGREWWWWIH